jgi:uncharacterized protein
MPTASEFLVDTSALIAFFVDSEQHHPAIRQFSLQHPEADWIVLSTVFDETVTWLRTRISPNVSVQVGQILCEGHRYIALSEADDQATWEAFCQYDDKRWSYTDCSLLVMSQRLGIPEVIAFDEHIRQMAGLGVICLPND